MFKINNFMNNFTSEIENRLGANLSNLPNCLLLIIVIYVVNKTIMKIFNNFYNNSKLDTNIKNILKLILKVSITFFSIMIIAGSLGINTSSLIAAFSIFGLAISLSVQNLMSNLANAISIYMNKPFKINDYVKIEDIEGTVLEIGFMLTKIMTYKNEIIYIPNTTIGSSIITNYTQTPVRRIEQIISASYDSDIDLVKKAINEAIMSEPLVLQNEEIFIAVQEYADSGINYDIRVYCNTTDYIKCKNSLMEKYKIYFDKYNITIPYKTITIYNN